MTPEELRAKMGRVAERVDPEVKGRAVNASFDMRVTPRGKLPDFRTQMVGSNPNTIRQNVEDA